MQLLGVEQKKNGNKIDTKKSNKEKKKTSFQNFIDYINGKGSKIGYLSFDEYVIGFLKYQIKVISLLINLYDISQFILLFIPTNFKKYFYNLLFKNLINLIKFTIRQIDEWLEMSNWSYVNFISLEKTGYTILQVNQIRREINYLRYVYKDSRAIILGKSQKNITIQIDNLYVSLLLTLKLIVQLMVMLDRIKNVMLVKPLNKKKLKLKDLKLINQINYNFLTLNFTALQKLGLLDNTDLSVIDFTIDTKFLLNLPNSEVKMNSIKSIERIKKLIKIL
jgi:hypothetical protein